ncbi:MAG: two-component system response regulator RegA [Oceanicoccus sp.]|jgi:two-component system response regulator RegA
MTYFQCLYLEDDEALAFVTCRGLTKRGFTVTHASSLAALNEMEDVSSYSHALLDLKLEDGHSLPVISDLIAANPSMKILVLTGYASIATTVQAIKTGATNYLVKPATIDQIVSAFDPHVAPKDIELDEKSEQLSLKRIEWEHIQQVLAENDGNVAVTAKQLKMHRRTLQRKLYKKPST